MGWGGGGIWSEEVVVLLGVSIFWDYKKWFPCFPVCFYHVFLFNSLDLFVIFEVLCRIVFGS